MDTTGKPATDAGEGTVISGTQENGTQKKAPEVDPRLDEKGNLKKDPYIKKTEAPGNTDGDKPDVKKPVVDDKPEAKPDDETLPDGSTTPNTTKDLEEKISKRAKGVEDLITGATLVPAELIARADLESGELSVADKAKLIEVHGDAIAGLIEGNIGKMITDMKAMGEARNEVVYTQLTEEFKGITDQSGADSWKELSGWFKANVASAERAELNKMLSAGGVSARLAVSDMVRTYKEKSGFTVEAELMDTSTSASKTDGGLISKVDYLNELEALERKGHVYGQSKEMQRLDNRRTRSIAQGY